MKIFSDKARTYLGWSQHDETTYQYLNRTAKPQFAAERARIEKWFDAYPENEKKSLCNRFPKNFEEAFFELYLHQLFLEMGYKITVEPKVANQKQPDFLLEKDGYKFYVEAKFVNRKSKQEIGQERKLSKLLDQLNNLELGDYALRIKRLEVKGEKTPSGKGLIQYILNAYEENPYHSKPLNTIIEDSIIFDAQLFQVNNPNWKTDPEKSTIMTYPTQAGFTSSVARFRKKISGKGKKYGELEHPLLVWVGFNGAAELSDYNLEEILFGGEYCSFPKDVDGLINTSSINWGRKNNGLFWDDRSARTTRASAILFMHVTPYGSMGYKMFEHPHPINSLDFHHFPIKRKGFVDSKLKDIEGEDIFDYLEIKSYGGILNNYYH